MQFIRYFFYLAFNWNPRIAWYIIRQEIKGERRYGINTTGADELKSLEKKGIDTSHATIYMPVSYALLEELLGELTILNTQPQTTNHKLLNHFLDIGCGKGRALCVAAHKGFDKVTGVDLSRELCTDAVKNLEATQQKLPALHFDVFNNDAFYYDIPNDTDCIFLFNPFDEIIMSGVANNLQRNLNEHPRKCFILYVNPVHIELFRKIGFRERWHSKKNDIPRGEYTGKPVVILDTGYQILDKPHYSKSFSIFLPFAV